MPIRKNCTLTFDMKIILDWTFQTGQKRKTLSAAIQKFTHFYCFTKIRSLRFLLHYPVLGLLFVLSMSKKPFSGHLGFPAKILDFLGFLYRSCQCILPKIFSRLFSETKRSGQNKRTITCINSEQVSTGIIYSYNWFLRILKKICVSIYSNNMNKEIIIFEKTFVGFSGKVGYCPKIGFHNGLFEQLSVTWYARLSVITQNWFAWLFLVDWLA